jgi:hypothetical protein
MSPSLTQGLSSSSNSFLSYTPLYTLYPVVLYSRPISIAAKTAYFLRAITFNTEEPSFFSEILEYIGIKNLKTSEILNFLNSKYIYSRVGKNPFKKKKTSPVGFFWFFWVFWSFFCPEERVLGFFSVSRILLGASRLQIIITLTN